MLYIYYKVNYRFCTKEVGNINTVFNITDKLLSQDKYISKKEYMEIIKLNSNSIISKVIAQRVELHNRKFVNSKLKEYDEYFNNIFKKVDKDVKLDLEQKTTILTDEDYCLVIAGAGAGKTTTLAAKVKYLVEKQNVDPEEIIVISYTNKAVSELKEKINKGMKIPAKVLTFHKLGNELLREDGNDYSILSNSYEVIKDILIKKIYKDKKLLDDLLYFLGCYMNVPEDVEKFESLDKYIEAKKEADYTSLKADIESYNEKMTKTLSKFSRTVHGETLRSYQEVIIANFLFLNNIDYEYEKEYKFKPTEMKRPYFPDFFISQGENEAYIEHFGMYTRNNEIGIFDKEALRKYEANMHKKIELHKRYNTKLISTYYHYDDGRDLIEHLKEELVKNGFVLSSRDPKEVFESIVESCKDKYISELAFFIESFINKFKTLQMNKLDFNILRSKTDNVRNKIFLELAEFVYDNYQSYLVDNNKIDFQDMINSAIEVIDNLENNNIKLNYKYIIIDEYQDIAKQRFNLTKKLSDACDAKVIAVGDDWQSIFAFAGSSGDYFIKFKELMGYAEELKITHTYRNSQELIDIAGDFVQKNDNQIKKTLVSNKHLKLPIRIYGYDDKFNYQMNKINLLIKIIDKLVKDFGENTSILLLCRYNFEIYKLVGSGQFQYTSRYDRLRCVKYPNLKITALTAHRSKGLGFDNVIILGATSGKYGFPSKIEDDPIMKLLGDKDEEDKLAEERRLFYVALTRTKNRVYILSPIYKPSSFVQELIKNYEVYADSKISLREEINSRKYCPVCGYPLVYFKRKLKNKIDLWVCSNEPEICDFMTNDLATKVEVTNCTKCDGYIIVKGSKKYPGRKVLGCTNYKEDGSGCNVVRFVE